MSHRSTALCQRDAQVAESKIPMWTKHILCHLSREKFRKNLKDISKHQMPSKLRIVHPWDFLFPIYFQGKWSIHHPICLLLRNALLREGLGLFQQGAAVLVPSNAGIVRSSGQSCCYIHKHRKAAKGLLQEDCIATPRLSYVVHTLYIQWELLHKSHLIHYNYIYIYKYRYIAQDRKYKFTQDVCQVAIIELLLQKGPPFFSEIQVFSDPA